MDNRFEKLLISLTALGMLALAPLSAEDMTEGELADQSEAMSAESNPVPAETQETPAAVAETAPETADSSGGQEYTILKGDTLWDLSSKYYSDPWLWKRIWQANSYVVNPDLIYYDKTLMIPGASVAASPQDRAMEQQAAVEQGEPTAETPAASAPEEVTPEASAEETASSSQSEEVDAEELAEAGPSLKELAQTASDKRLFTGDSFVAPRDWEFDGFVTAERDQKMMISAGDIIYLDMGTQQGVAPKTQCLVYRKGRKVFHPASGEFLGFLVRKVALIEVNSEVVDQAAAADVIVSYEPVAIGDLVRVLPEHYKKH